MNTREIKFRGKRVDNGEWVYGYYFDGYILQYIDLAQSWTPLTSDHKVTCRAFEVIPESVGQYCGLKDKNNKEIYEGDIVHKWYSRDTSGTDIVEWNEVVQFECYGEKSGFEITFLDRCEVVGNIHETPHLIKNQTA